MKLVDVAEFYSEQGGGVRTYIHQKLKAATALGHELVIIAPGQHDRQEAHSGGKIIWIKSPYERFDKRYHRFVDAAAIHRHLDIEKPDVVEASSPWMGARAVASWQATSNTRKAIKSFIFHQDPVAVYPQTLLGGMFNEKTIDKIFGWFWTYLRKLAGQFDTTIVASHWLENRLQSFGIGKPHAVPFGIEKQLFSPNLQSKEKRDAMLKSCGIADPDARLIICVSRHHPEKRLGTVLDAFAEVAKTAPRALIVVGDGPTRQFVRRHAARIPGVYIAGRINDQGEVAAMLASSDALVHGGAAETFGLVIAEALCSGLPVVVPDRGGAADFADPLYSEIYKTGDKHACANAIKRLLARSPEALHLAARDAGLARVWTPSDHFNALFKHYDTELRENVKVVNR